MGIVECSYMPVECTRTHTKRLGSIILYPSIKALENGRILKAKKIPAGYRQGIYLQGVIFDENSSGIYKSID